MAANNDTLDDSDAISLFSEGGNSDEDEHFGTPEGDFIRRLSETANKVCEPHGRTTAEEGPAGDQDTPGTDVYSWVGEVYAHMYMHACMHAYVCIYVCRQFVSCIYKYIRLSYINTYMSLIHKYITQLIDTVPALRASNAAYMQEVQVLQQRISDARLLHAREIEALREQMMAALALERQALEREREDWKRCHLMELEAGQDEREQLRHQVNVLKASNAQMESTVATLRGQANIESHFFVRSIKAFTYVYACRLTVEATQIRKHASWRTRPPRCMGLRINSVPLA